MDTGRATSGRKASGLACGDAPSNEVCRDAQYYLDDGDVVIRAEDTLFKAHRFLLSRDSSTFQNMFGSGMQSSNQTPAENSDDAHPLVLQDRADQIRALLWVLYALPHELRVVTLPDGETAPDIQRLLTVAEITSKYRFSSLELWARNAVRKAITTYPFGRSSSLLLERILAVAHLCNDVELRDAIVSLWLNLIFKSTISPIPALAAADRYSLRRFQGLAYYQQLQRMERAVEHTKMPISELPECKELSQDQLMRILAGHWSLTTHSERVCRTPTVFSPGRRCSAGRHAQCARVWQSKWQEAIRKYEMTRHSSLAEVMRKVFFLETVLSNDEELGDSKVFPCREEALKSLQRYSQTVADGLWEHFSIPRTEDNS